MPIHPKVGAAIIAAVVVAVLQAIQALAGAYPDDATWRVVEQAATLIIPLVAAWAKTGGAKGVAVDQGIAGS